MIESVGMVAALLSELRSFLSRRKDRKDQTELLAIRAALKQLYFGEQTLDALTRAQGGDVSKAVIAYSDSAESVRNALDKLSRIAEEEGCSIALQEMLKSVNYQKVTIREQIVASLYFATDRSENEWKKIEDEIRAINTTIEELDLLIGGLWVKG